MLTNPKVLHWPALFRDYLFHNPYLSPGMSIYWLPPLGTLQLMGVAWLMVLASPWTALTTEIAVFGVAVALFALLLPRLRPLPARTAVLLAAPLCFAYPALFMLDRGNFNSGYTSLCVAAYFCTAITGRWRWLGIAALCYAINVRPNTAVVTMVELVLAPNLLAAVRVPVLIATLSGAVFGLSLFAAHHVDHVYSFSSFWGAYGLYQQDYIVDGLGLASNDSLYGAVTILRLMIGLAPAYSATASHAVTAVGVLVLLGFVWLAVNGRMRRAEAVFAAAVSCTLFTPVYGEYHILIFVSVLLVLGLETAAGTAVPRLGWALPGFALLAPLACAADMVPSPATALLLMLGSRSSSLPACRRMVALTCRRSSPYSCCRRLAEHTATERPSPCSWRWRWPRSTCGRHSAKRKQSSLACLRRLVVPRAL